MAFSYDPEGGIAVARILSDHPDDNGKIVYLHRYYEPAIDDAWYDQPDQIPAALPPGHAPPRNSNSADELDEKHGAGSGRQRPQTIPLGSGPGYTTFTTQEIPDTEFAFPAATAGAAGPKGRALLRGGAFGDETAADDGKSEKQSAGAGGGAAGRGDDTIAQLGALSGSGAGSAASVAAAAAAAGASATAARPGILKRPRKAIHFDQLPAKDQHGQDVQPRRRSRQRQRQESKDGLGYPLPTDAAGNAKDPDKMSDAEFEAWASSLDDEQWDAFCDHMDDLDGDSADEDGDDEMDDSDVEDLTPLRKRPRMQAAPPGLSALHGGAKPIATNPNRSSSGVSASATPLELLGPDYFQRGSSAKNKLGDKDVKRMAAELAYGPHHVPNYSGPKAATMKKIHEEAREALARRQMGKEIELFGGDCFRLIPSWPKRECIFIVGQQGAGKSWFAGRYIREWKKQHPDGKVIVFSQVADDKELDKCGITRVMIDDGLVENPYEVKELNNCLVVFDDIDAIRDKKIKKAVTDLCDELQVIGRHENTWVLRTSHLFRNWGTTRASLAESNKTVFFPQLGSSYGIKSWLKTHVGLDPKKIERMFKLRSRWVALDQHAPNWVLSEHLLYIL